MVKKFLGATLLLASLCVPRAVFAQANSSGETPGHQPKLTKLPKLVHFEEAPYPDSEKEAGRTASVVLQIAIDAAKRMAFNSATRCGKSVKSTFGVSMRFVLGE